MNRRTFLASLLGLSVVRFVRPETASRFGQVSMQVQDIAIQCQKGASAAGILAQQGYTIRNVFNDAHITFEINWDPEVSPGARPDEPESLSASPA